MSKNKKHESARRIGNLMVVAGALIWTAGTSLHSSAAQLSNQGSAIGTQVPTELTWTVRETVLSAATEPSGAGGVLAFGMLMMLIGFGIHAWHILNRQEGRIVPVRIRKQSLKKPEAKKSRSSRRQAEVIWIERTIRF